MAERASSLVDKYVNNLLVSLGGHEELGIKRYARLRRLMPFVKLKFSLQGLEGVEVDQGRLGERRAVILDEGKHVVWESVARPSAATLLAANKLLMNEVFRYAFFTNKEVVFDLDARSISGLAMDGMHLSRSDRRECMTGLLKMESITINMATDSTSTDFDGSRALSKWAHVPSFYKSVVTNRQWPFSDNKAVNFVLSFTEFSGACLAYVRIDIQCLVKILLYAYKKATITFRRAATNKCNIQAEEATTNLATILRRVFLLLSDAIIKAPDRTHQELPEIWIDGLGNVLGLKYRATTTDPQLCIPSRAQSSSDEDVENAGYWSIYSTSKVALEMDLPGPFDHYTPCASECCSAGSRDDDGSVVWAARCVLAGLENTWVWPVSRAMGELEDQFVTRDVLKHWRPGGNCRVGNENVLVERED